MKSSLNTVDADIKRAIHILKCQHRKAAARVARDIILHADELGNPYGPGESLIADGYSELSGLHALVCQLERAMTRKSDGPGASQGDAPPQSRDKES